LSNISKHGVIGVHLAPEGLAEFSVRRQDLGFLFGEVNVDLKSLGKGSQRIPVPLGRGIHEPAQRQVDVVQVKSGRLAVLNEQ
jgi:hypothetical protein